MTTLENASFKKVSAALALALTLTACSGPEGESRATAPPVSVTVSYLSPHADVARFAGRIDAPERSAISTRLSERVRAVHVREGDRVRAGQALVELDPSEVDARIHAAAAADALARAYFARIDALARAGAASDQERDEALARRETAEARLAEARAQLEHVTLRAPYDGYVVERRVDPGSLSTPGEPLLVLLSEGTANVSAELPAEVWPSVAVGAEHRVADPVSGWEGIGTVSLRTPLLEGSTRRFRTEWTLSGSADPPLSGTQVDVEIVGATPTGLWIHEDALVHRGQLTGVFTVEHDTLRLRWIRPGVRSGSAVEVLAGLDIEVGIVRRPADGLRDGREVGPIRVEEWIPNPADPTATRSVESRPITEDGS